MNLRLWSVLLTFSFHFAPTQASDIWAVKIDGDAQVAQRLSYEYGYEYVQKLEGFDNIYVLKKKNYVHRNKREASEATTELLSNSSILWAEHQESKTRVKRGIIPPREIDDILDELSENQNQNTWVKFVRSFPVPVQQKLIVNIAFKAADVKTRFNDDLWSHQWYLHESPLAKTDHGITEVWKMGFTGRNIKVCILDDGVEGRHPDIRANYDHNASYDMNDEDGDPSKFWKTLFCNI